MFRIAYSLGKLIFYLWFYNRNSIGINHTQRRKAEIYSESDFPFSLPACIVAGVALEITLKELCNRNNVPIAKMETMNIELCKKDIYNMGMQKQVTTWAHWRNKAAHGEWNEYNNEDVNDMIRGVTRFVAEYL